MILVTGAAGFIGLNYIHLLSTTTGLNDVVIVDKLTYAANESALRAVPNAKLEIVDIADAAALDKVFDRYKIEYVINFAAESHVDNSIKDCMPFIQSNIIGTVNLLQLSLKHHVKKFLQISTDEVFGQAEFGSAFTEKSKINPRNPYSASKASAEHFVWAFHNTYGLPAVIVNCSNNYGPYQYKEKLIPLAISKIRKGEPVPVYGNGSQIRDWIYVEDACRAIDLVFRKGRVGERYCIGGDNEIANIDLVQKIIDAMGQGTLEFVKDRPGHDYRYYTDCSKLKDELGWEPKWTLDQGIKETVRWYNENRI